MLKNANEKALSGFMINLKTDIMPKFADACNEMIAVAA